MASRKKESKVKRVLDCVIIILVLLSLISISLFIYYKHINKDITIGANYITEQLSINDIDEMSEEEREMHERRTLFTANLYSNDKGNGIQLQELKMNYFTDWTLNTNTYRSTGMQYVGDVAKEDFTLQSGSAFGVETIMPDLEMIDPRFNYYDTTNGISWSGTVGDKGTSTSLRRSQVFVISIDNHPYAIQLDKYRTFKRTGVLGIEIVNSKFYATWGGLFQSIMQAIKSNNKGYGEYYITLDLSEYFSIKKYDKESGKFLDDDVTDVIKTYAEIKFKYSASGAKNVNQSIFGSIQCDNSYGLSDAELNAEYWQERIIYNFNQNNLSYRYSEVAGGYYLSLDTVTKAKLKAMKRVKVIVNINTNETDKTVIGLDYDAFKGIEIESLIISGQGEFKLLEGSLIDTNIQTISKDAGINLIVHENATNKEFTEVVLWVKLKQ